MRVLVTGSVGFIGSAIVSQLTARGHEVVGVDRLTGVDVRDEDALTALLDGVDGVDAVCHQAAKVGLGLTIHDAPDYASINTLGTATLLSAMARRHVNVLVQASSMVVYGSGATTCPVHGVVGARPRSAADLADGIFDPACARCGERLGWAPVSEDFPLDPRNAYAATKLSQEHLAVAWTEQTGGTAVSLRYHNVYGPGMPRDTPYAGVAAIFRSQLAQGVPPRVFEDGGQMRDFVHVSDVARANVIALEAAVTAGPGHRAYNVASGHPRSVLDLATALADAMHGPAPMVVGGGRAGDVRHIVADPTRIRDELGFRAEIEFEAGIGDLVGPATIT